MEENNINYERLETIVDCRNYFSVEKIMELGKEVVSSIFYSIFLIEQASLFASSVFFFPDGATNADIKDITGYDLENGKPEFVEILEDKSKNNLNSNNYKKFLFIVDDYGNGNIIITKIQENKK